MTERPAPMITAEVKPAGVILHQHEDVGFLIRRVQWNCGAKERSRGYKQRQAAMD